MVFWGSKKPKKGSMQDIYEGEDRDKSTKEVLWSRFISMRIEPGVLHEYTIQRIHQAIEDIIKEEQPELGYIQVRALQGNNSGGYSEGFEINMKVTGASR